MIKIIGVYDGWGVRFEESIWNEDNPISPLPDRLVGVTSFGPVGLSGRAFYHVEKLELMPQSDIPDASKLKDLGHSFEGASRFNAPIGHWDVSNVTDMSMMFVNAKRFNQLIVVGIRRM